MNKEMTLRWLAMMIVGFFALCLLSVLSTGFGSAQANRQVIALDAAGAVSSGITETFESGLTLPTDWSTVDNDANGFEHIWAPITAPVSIGNGPSITMTDNMTDDTIVWAIGGGAAGSTLDPDPASSDSYSANTKSALFFGPIDLTGVATASVAFDYWFDGNGSDLLSVGTVTGTANADNLTAQLQISNTMMPTTTTWLTHSMTISGNQSDVYLVFYFESKSAGGNPNQKGAFIDNVMLVFAEPTLVHLPLMRFDNTPTPSPTPTPNPALYRDDFNGDITGWEDRERNLYVATDNTISNANSTYLQVSVEKEDQFVIVSPLEEGADREYEVESRIRFVTPTADDEFGIIFAADWNTGQACPDGDQKFETCFNEYYLLRIIYRDGGDSDDALEYRIEEVKGHDEPSGNTPNFSTLKSARIDPSVADPVDWNVFKIRYENDNDIKLFINNTEIGADNRAQDGTYALQKYFGVYVATDEGNEFASAQFDYYAIGEAE